MPDQSGIYRPIHILNFSESREHIISGFIADEKILLY